MSESEGRPVIDSDAHPRVIDTEARQRMIDALCAPELAGIVDLVVWVDDEGEPYAANHLGTVRFHFRDGAEVVAGTNPIGSEDPMAFLPYEQELANPSPRVSTDNAYPLAWQRLRSFFADPDRSPDLAIIHTPRHFFPEQGGHVGEHGSLDVIQSRAPLILSGAGVKQQGYVDGFARLVDVGPTLAFLAGVPAMDLVDAEGQGLDGRVLRDYLETGGGQRRHVIGMLWDGAHCGDLLHLARSGELPGVARLIENGVALRGGAVAEFPSITLTNHTSILTGTGPGRHGVMGNVYYDRETGERVVPNDQSTWHRSADWLRPAARTVFEMVGKHATGAKGSVRTASIDEAIDRGADYSTMALIRESGESGADALDDALPDAATSPYLRDAAYLEDSYFRWGVRVDDLGIKQMTDLFASAQSAPLLTWWASVVTDCGHHGGGPRSDMARDALRQSDARLVTFLDHLNDIGLADHVTFVLTADHGFEGADPEVTGSWKDALDATGVPYRDEGPGLVYLL
jgi:phosphonoacetate hydrolase